MCSSQCSSYEFGGVLVIVCLYFNAQDPEAKKPEDWDDREKIDDPEDSKPEDWDQPEHVADPDAKKPDDWDDEMDGEWEPPMIDNPDYKVNHFPPITQAPPT